MKTTEYIAAIKARHNVTSDYAVSKLLGVSRTSVSEWQKGKGAFGTLTCFKVAELLGDQPAAVIADIELERAEQLQKEDDADAWRKWVKRLGGTAASVLLAAGLGGMSNADARLASSQNSSNIHIVSTKKKRGWWGGPLGLAL
jgi:DNA-binding transcriptional regulator YdaS (Cro superfamily)